MTNTPQDSQTLTADAVAYRWRYKYKALGNTEWMFMAAIPSDMLLDNVEIEPLFRQPQDTILQRLVSALRPFSAVADNAIDWPQDAHVLRPGIDYPAHIENAAPPVLVKHLRPIVGIENRTAQEVFDIMSDRIKRADLFAENAKNSTLPSPLVSGEAVTQTLATALDGLMRLYDDVDEGDKTAPEFVAACAALRQFRGLSPITNEPVVSFASYMQAPMKPSPIKSPHSAGVFPKDHIPDAGKMVEPEAKQ